MYEQNEVNAMPGLGTTRMATYKPIWLSRVGVQYLPGGGRIDGMNARDPSNVYGASGNQPTPPNALTSYPQVLQAGLLMGKISASGAYGASVFGLTSAAIIATATSFKVPIAVGQELIRRLGGVAGSIKLTGPAIAGGAVNTDGPLVTSNIAATGDGTTYTVTMAQTTHAFVAGSLVQPADGSEVIRTFIDSEDGIRVTNMDGSGIDVQFPRIPIAGGVVLAPNIVNYPADSALQTWVKAQLNAVGLQYAFSDNY